eukprot:5215921-Prymnesium_polylepis.1
MPLSAVNGIELYYELHGDASRPKLLYLLETSAECRKPLQQQVIATYKDRFHLLLFDHRGTGRSTLDRDPDHYSMEAFAADAFALVRKVGWNTCNVMGVSFGSCLAQELAIRYPRLLNGCALVLASGPAAGGGLPIDSDMSDFRCLYSTFRGLDSRNGVVFSAFTAAYVLCKMPQVKHIDEDRREDYWRTTRWLQFGARKKHDTAARARAARRLAVPPNGPDDQLPSTLTPRTLMRAVAGLASLRCRTLVVSGEYDLVCPTERARELCALIQGAELKVFPIGHLLGAAKTVIAEGYVLEEIAAFVLAKSSRL